MAIDLMALAAARVREVRTLRTGHRVHGPWQGVARVSRRSLTLDDGTSWPLPTSLEEGVYPADGPVHLEIKL